MEISCIFPTGPRVVEYIELAESLGYHRAWLNDSPALYQDVWMALARAADRTERIGLGPSVLVPSLRHVMTTAAAIATLEQLAPGRVAVAVGTGYTGRRVLGQPALSWASVEEYVRALRALLRGEEAEVDGQPVKMIHPPGWTPPFPIATPILIAANGPKGLAVAHDLGDGVLTMGGPQAGFAWCAATAGGTVLDPGEDPESPRVLATLAPGFAFTYHYLYATAGPGVDMLPGGAEWRADIEAIPEETRHIYVNEGHLVHMTDRDRAYVQPQTAMFGLTGTAAEVGERLAALEEAGVTEMIYGPFGEDIPRELRTWAGAAGL